MRFVWRIPAAIGRCDTDARHIAAAFGRRAEPRLPVLQIESPLARSRRTEVAFFSLEFGNQCHGKCYQAMLFAEDFLVDIEHFLGERECLIKFGGCAKLSYFLLVAVALADAPLLRNGALRRGRDDVDTQRSRLALICRER